MAADKCIMLSLGKQNLKATFPNEKTEIQVSFSTPAEAAEKPAEAAETSTLDNCLVF